MSIAPLPASSVASLTSSQTLTNPPSLLKELIENSLDAGATSISVDVSPNLLDSIQVRDNGHGISPEGRDRELVAKRHCTSKLRGMMDLALVRSLGFRGEALASAAEMGELKIITRVDGEKTAVILDIDRGGNIVSQKSTSAPQGTTVKVTNFLKSLPVRREVVAKAPQKLYPQIRKLLITYALSRPDVRFSFRIVGGPKKAAGKSEDWVYAPSKLVHEAVTKIVGKEISSNCVWKEFDTSENEDDMHFDPEGMKIDALLISPGVDPKKVGKKGHATAYIFVDSRPVSTARHGIFKSIITLYKNYLKSAHPNNEAYSDPFIYLNFHCPLGFYDPNVEPAKDDVIFTNNTRVLDGVEKLFKSVYGDKEESERSSAAKSAHARAGVERQEGFNLLLAKKTPAKQVMGAEEASSNTMELQGVPEEDRSSRSMDQVEPPRRLSSPTLTPSQTPDTAPTSEPPITSSSLSATEARELRTRKPTNWGTNMHSGDLSSDEEMLRDVPDNGPREPAPEEQGRDSTNPWILSKMNARVTSSNNLSSSTGLRSSSPVRQLRDSSPPTSPSRQPGQRASQLAKPTSQEPLSKRQRLSQDDFYSSPFVQYMGNSAHKMDRINARTSQRAKRADGDGQQEESQTPRNNNNHSLDRWIVSGQSGNVLAHPTQQQTEEDISSPTQLQGSEYSPTQITPRTRRIDNAPIRLTPTHSAQSTRQLHFPQTPTQNSCRRRRKQDNAFDHLITTPFKSPLQDRGVDIAPRPISFSTPNATIARAGFQTAATALAEGVGRSSPIQEFQDPPQVLPEPFINALLFPKRGPKTTRKCSRADNGQFTGVELELDDLDAEMDSPPGRRSRQAPEEHIKSKKSLSTSDVEDDAAFSQQPASLPRRLITPDPVPAAEAEEGVPFAQPPVRRKSKKSMLTAEDLLAVGPMKRIQGKHPPEDCLKPLLLKVEESVERIRAWAVRLDNEDAYLGRCLWEDKEVNKLVEGWLEKMGAFMDRGEGEWELVPAVKNEGSGAEEYGEKTVAI